jgi:hypothetical protein
VTSSEYMGPLMDVGRRGVTLVGEGWVFLEVSTGSGEKTFEMDLGASGLDKFTLLEDSDRGLVGVQFGVDESKVCARRTEDDGVLLPLESGTDFLSE